MGIGGFHDRKVFKVHLPASNDVIPCFPWARHFRHLFWNHVTRNIGCSVSAHCQCRKRNGIRRRITAKHAQFSTGPVQNGCQLGDIGNRLLVCHKIGTRLGKSYDGFRIDIHDHTCRIVIECHRNADGLTDRFKVFENRILGRSDIRRHYHHHAIGALFICKLCKPKGCFGCGTGHTVESRYLSSAITRHLDNDITPLFLGKGS